jgi:hypothetical protein
MHYKHYLGLLTELLCVYDKFMLTECKYKKFIGFDIWMVNIAISCNDSL